MTEIRVSSRIELQEALYEGQAKIGERVLFPGLDGLSRWVARYYTPR